VLHTERFEAAVTLRDEAERVVTFMVRALVVERFEAVVTLRDEALSTEETFRVVTLVVPKRFEADVMFRVVAERVATLRVETFPVDTLAEVTLAVTMFAPIKKVVPETLRDEETLAVARLPEVTLAVTIFAPIKKVVPETFREAIFALAILPEVTLAVTMFAPIRKVVPETLRDEETLAVVIFPEVTLAVTIFAPIKKVVPETLREEETLAVVIFPEVTLAVTMFAPIKKVVPETLRDTTLAWVVTLILRALIERTKAEPNWEPSWPRFDEPETFGKRFPDSTVDVLRTVRFPNSNVLPVVATSPKLVMTGILLFTEVFSSARVADHVVVLCPWGNTM
jgi:hypothetical protein